MIENFKTGPLDNNVYALVDEETGRCAVVDPGIDSGHILAALRARGLTVAEVVNTHGHFDHVVGNKLFMGDGSGDGSGGAGGSGGGGGGDGEIPLYRHPLDEEMALAADRSASRFGLVCDASPLATRTLDEGDTYAFGPHRFEILHVPGHSPGSVVLVGDGLIIAGDVLFRGSVGRTDLPGGSMPQLLQGIRGKLMPLPDDTRVLPGHGPETTIGRERRANPFI